MRYTSAQITFQEVPDEITLSFLVNGCPLRCSGCHSADAWNSKNGQILDLNVLESYLEKYKGFITCVCFLGGEWHPKVLIELCTYCQSRGLKTCLYTGYDDVDQALKDKLTFLKVGRYIASLGGLSSATTNQKFIHLPTYEIWNHKFITQGGLNDTTERTTT